MKKMHVSFLLLIACLLPAEAKLSFMRMEAGVFYTDHQGGALTVRLEASYNQRNLNDKGVVTTVIPGFLATLYDPDEKAVRDFYWRDESEELKKVEEYTVDNARKGIWQLRFAQPNAAPVLNWSVNFTPSEEIGFMPSRCWIFHKDILEVSGRYFLVPPGTSAPLDLFVKYCRAEIIDLQGNSVAVLENSESRKVALEAGQVYQLNLSAKDSRWCWAGFGGFPFILCKTAELAKKLNGGVTALPDGRYVQLKFQKRVYDWQKSLTRADLEVAPADLTQYQAEILADWPQSTALFFIAGALSTAKYLIENQNIDLDSPEFGKCNAEIGPLAYLYTLNKPYNPYYRNKAILNRVALAYLYKLALSSRSTYFPLCGNGTSQDIPSNYAGGDGMVMVPESVAFMLLSDQLASPLKELWAEALAFPLRRFFSDRVSCENQSIHWAVKLHAFAAATGNALFKKLAENYIKDVGDEKLNSSIRTGYLREANGPDATYQGLCASLLAYYAFFSGDQQAYAIWDKIATLFNHTVAPEPDGKILFGASGFSHRTPNSWIQRQYGGGTSLLTDKFESAAVWHRLDEFRSKKDLATYIAWASGKSAFDYYREHTYAVGYAFCSFSSCWNLIPPRPVIQDAKLPVEKETSFTRNFNQEFFFVRRPTYYLAAYAGKTGGKDIYFTKYAPLDSNKWKLEGDVLKASSAGGFFSALPGPQLFWTPKFGVLLCSMNWSLYTHWTTRLEGEKLDWVEYGSGETNFENDLEMILKFRTDPLEIKRRMAFAEKNMEVHLQYGALPAASQMIEQLPYIVKKGTKLQYRNGNSWSTAAGMCDALRWTNEDNEGIIAEFNKPVEVRPGKQFLFYADTRLCCLEILLPENGFTYSLEEIKPAQ